MNSYHRIASSRNCWEECEQRKAKESAKRSGEKCVRLKLNCSAQLSSTANTLNWIRISSRAVDRCDIYISFHFNRLAGNRDRERARACGKSYWNSKQTETWNNSNAIYYFKNPTNEFLLFALTVFLLHVCIRLRRFVCAVFPPLLFDWIVRFLSLQFEHRITLTRSLGAKRFNPIPWKLDELLFSRFL